MALAAAGSALALVGAYFLSSYYAGSPSGPRGAIDDIDEETSDVITSGEVVKIFDKLFLELQSVLGQLMQQIQQLQMMGQQIPERQLKSLLKGEMTRALKAKQSTILDEFGIDYDCFEEATWEFIAEGDEKVKRVVERFQKLWESTTGDEVVGYSPGKDPIREGPVEILEKEKLLDAAQKYFDAITRAMYDLHGQYKAEGLNLKEHSVQQKLNMEFAEKANEAGEAVLHSEGTSMKQFEESVRAYSNDPAVGRALGMMQMKQQQELVALQG